MNINGNTFIYLLSFLNDFEILIVIISGLSEATCMALKKYASAGKHVKTFAWKFSRGKLTESIEWVNFYCGI